MKKYLLTALLGVFAFVGFVSADSVDGFTSDSEICKEYSSVGNYDYTCNSMINNFNDFYMCVSSNSPYYLDSSLGGGISMDINTDNYCFSQAFSWDDDVIGFYNNESDYQNVPGTFYFSHSPITYSSSVGGDSGGSLLPGGEGDLSGIISGLNSVIDEFLPYLVYIGLGLITATIGFIAIRWLVNRTSAKVRGTFSSGKRRR